MSDLPLFTTKAAAIAHFKQHPEDIERYLTGNWGDFPPTNNQDAEDLLDFCECVIFGSENPKEELEKLKEKGVLKSSLCGHLWVQGDTAYKCRTCERTDSSAICVDCFQNGNHEGHDYMLIKIAGGFCDCGDPYSWREAGFCSRHQPSKSGPSREALTLPPYMEISAPAVIRVILNRLLKLERDPTSLADDLEGSVCVTTLSDMVLYGDAFRKILMDSLQVIDVAPDTTVLDSLYKLQDEADETNPDLFEELSHFFFRLLIVHDFTKTFLKRYFLPYYEQHIVDFVKGEGEKHEQMFTEFSVQLFTAPHLAVDMKEANALNIVLDRALFVFQNSMAERQKVVNKTRRKPKKDEDEDMPPLIDPSTGKTEKSPEPPSKPQPSTPTASSSTEIVTAVPPPFPDFQWILDNKNEVIYGRLYSPFTVDLGYLLSHKLLADQLVEVDDLFTMWVRLMALPQGMNPNTILPKGRYSAENWISSFATELDLWSSLHHVLNSVPHDLNRMNSLIGKVARFLGHWLRGWNEHKDVVDPTAPVHDKKGKKEKKDGDIVVHRLEPVSFHLPLHRMLSAFLRKTLETNLNNNLSLESVLNSVFESVGAAGIRIPEYCSQVLHHPLQIQVMLAQIRACLWRAGGEEEEIWAQSVMYGSVHYQKYFDWDIFLIQVCAVLQGAKMFMQQAIQQYGLEDWFQLAPITHQNTTPQTPAKNPNNNNNVPSTPSSNTTTTASTPGPSTTTVPATPLPSRPPPTEDEAEQQKIMAEDFLQFIITLIRERTLSGMDEVSFLRRELIHRLALGDLTHSQIKASIQHRLGRLGKSFDATLSQVSVYHTPHGMEQGKYALKEECWSEFDVYFSHYSRQELQAAEERYHQAYRSKCSPKQIPPHKPYSALQSIVSLLACKLLHQVIFTILRNHFTSPKHSSDTLLNHALYLIELYLVVTPELSGFNFEEDEPIYSPKRFKPVDVFHQKYSSISLPSSHSLLRNATAEVVTSEDGKTRESLISLLLRLENTTQDAQKKSVDRILTLFTQNGIPVDDFRGKVQGSSSSKELSDAERKRKAREIQQAMMASMKTQQAAFNAISMDEDYEDDDLQNQGMPFYLVYKRTRKH
eukprot:TRINITY_DN8126_c0_g1_i1.p1 TRINITY_DN8126_c0_g1~~TRINITY_DN8126_c0_g1_i1.p1  ORF type:complete len:1102 (-),score=291.96 TRINITY_DN8126_c0_g1_i1:57-3362(-)